MHSKLKLNNLSLVKGFIVLFYFLSSLFSCRTWQDSDLYIPEVFINEKNELYLILKNAGHTYIDRQHIDLVVYWDEDQRIVFDLDSLDPHFRNGGDSSIILLPFIPGLNAHHILARVDTKNVLPESDEYAAIQQAAYQFSGSSLLSGAA